MTTTSEVEAWDKGFSAGVEAGLQRVLKAEAERDLARRLHGSARGMLTTAWILLGGAVLGLMVLLLKL